MTVQHHTIIFGDTYQELLQRIFDGGEVGDDLSLYLHRPTATDPALAPEGKDAFYVLAPVPNLQRDDWQTVKANVKERVLDILEARVLPDLRHHLEVCFDFDPTDFAQQYHSHWGAGFSIAPIFTQSAFFRFHIRAEDFDNLYFVGAGTHPGAGVPGVLSPPRLLRNFCIKTAPTSDRHCHDPATRLRQSTFTANAKTFALAARFLPKARYEAWRGCMPFAAS